MSEASSSGIGGIDLGLERAGMRVAWQAESDEWCRGILARHWPDVPCYHDVRAIGSDAPRVDVLCGGFPCQDVSIAGKRAGLAGERSGLFHEFARIADALRPAWLLIENVPGLLSSNGGRDFGVVAGTLAELGYGIAWRVLDSRYFGVPQRRRRVFIVGRARGDSRSALRALCEGCGGSPIASRSTWQEAARRARASARADGGPDVIAGSASGLGIAAPLGNVTGGARSTDVEAATWVVPQTFTFQPDDDGEVTGAIRAREIDTAPALDTTADARSTERGVRVVERAGVRRLTPRECERLQSFPDDWTLVPGMNCPDTRRYGAMGNAVTVNVAEWIGRRIVAIESTEAAFAAEPVNDQEREATCPAASAASIPAGSPPSSPC